MPRPIAVYGAPSPPIFQNPPQNNRTLGQVSVGKPVVRRGSVENAERVVAGMRAGFRSCYQRGLAIDPTLRGRLRLSLEVDAQGHVASVTPRVESGRLEAAVIGCITTRAGFAQFEAPQGSDTAHVEFTMTSTPPPKTP